MAIDPRMMQVTIDIGDISLVYEDLAITVTGSKFTNLIQGDAIISIANISNDVRDFILTEGTPFLRDRLQSGKTIRVDAGRLSTGLSPMYIGNIFRATISNPPDQIIGIRAISQQAAKGNIVQNNFPGAVSLETIARQIADDIGLNENGLVYEAGEAMVSDYSYTGSALGQIRRLQQIDNIDAWIDNNTLFVINSNQTINLPPFVLTPENGMVGIPQPTEQGIRVQLMFDNNLTLGRKLDIVSNRYPSLTGQYKVYKISYNLTNRDTPFYMTADANRLI